MSGWTKEQNECARESIKEQRGKEMKTLHTEGHYNLAYLNENNYVVWDSRKDKRTTNAVTGDVSVKHEYKYHCHMYTAIRHLSKFVVDESAQTLKEWVRDIVKMQNHLAHMCGEEK